MSPSESAITCMAIYTNMTAHTSSAFSLLLIGAAASAIVYLTYLWLLPKPLPGIPYNKESSKRILGDLPRLHDLWEAGDCPRRLWTTAAAELKAPIAQVFLGPLNKPMVVVSDFRESYDLQVRHSKWLGRGPYNNDMWQGLIPEHFIAMDDWSPRYKHARGLNKDLMTAKFLNEVNAPASHSKLDDFIALWREKIRVANGRPFEAIDDIRNMAYDQLRSLRSLADGIPPFPGEEEVYPFIPTKKPLLLETMEGFAAAAVTCITTPSPKLFHMVNNMTPRMRRLYRLKKQLLQEYIDQAAERLNTEGEQWKPLSAIDYMVSRESDAARKAGQSVKLANNSALSDSLLGYLVGGHDSTHATLSFTVKVLGQKQDIQAKLRATLFEAYPEARAAGQQPDLADMLKAKVPYLDAFIEEVLRCENPSLVINKKSVVDLDILGYHVPAGTILFFNSYGPTINYAGARVDESVRRESAQKHHQGLGDWADSEYPPGEFYPERWLKISDDSIVFDANAGPTLTFGVGPRMCWGKRLAYLELKLAVTAMVWNFMFENIPEHLYDEDITDDLFIKPRHTYVKLSNVPKAGMMPEFT
ncbi:Cytochrome P450 monooxygenase TRI13 [Paramyrothecium foliicola]|nr:Cytochrome P450 monooxygenase TRI13 [Paramyrothecium foliicola]